MSPVRPFSLPVPGKALLEVDDQSGRILLAINATDAFVGVLELILNEEETSIEHARGMSTVLFDLLRPHLSALRAVHVALDRFVETHGHVTEEGSRAAFAEGVRVNAARLATHASGFPDAGAVHP